MKLTPSQQDILKRYTGLYDFDQLPCDVQDEIHDLCDYEAVEHDSSIFLWDQFMSFEQQQWKLL